MLMKTNKPIIYILIISLIPILVSLVLFNYHSRFHTMNKGNLINPSILIHSADLSRQWQIAYKPIKCCDQLCQETLQQLHQLHLVLGNNYNRVRLNLIVEQSCKLPEYKYFSRLAIKEILPKDISGTIYLIDPEGNAFMYYPATVDRMAIMKDLKRVLEVSQIG